MRGDPHPGTERAGDPGDAGRYRDTAPQGRRKNRGRRFEDGVDRAERGEWLERTYARWRARRIAGRYSDEPASGESPGPRRRSSGEIFGDAAAVPHGGNGGWTP